MADDETTIEEGTSAMADDVFSEEGTSVMADDVFSEEGSFFSELVAMMARNDMDEKVFLDERVKLLVNEIVDGETLLHHAVRFARTSLVRLLMREHGARQCHNKNGKRPIDVAMSRGFHQVVEVLFMNDGSREPHPTMLVRLFERMRNNNSSSEAASEIVHFGRCFELWMEFFPKYSVNVRDSKGNTPLHAAARNCAPEKYVLMLLDRGALLRARNKEGETPLQFFRNGIIFKHLENCLLRDEREKYRTLEFATTTGGTWVREESEMLLPFAKNRYLRPLLSHPLLSRVLEHQWRIVRWFVLMKVFVLVMYALVVVFAFQRIWPALWVVLCAIWFVRLNWLYVLLYGAHAATLSDYAQEVLSFGTWCMFALASWYGGLGLLSTLTLAALVWVWEAVLFSQNWFKEPARVKNIFFVGRLPLIGKFTKRRALFFSDSIV